MIFLIIAGLMCISHAHAYLDSGSGSMLIQLLLGGFVGVGVFLKFYWNKIVSFFKRNKNE